MAEHDNFVNSCCPLRRGPPLLVSGSDDGTAKVRGFPRFPSSQGSAPTAAGGDRRAVRLRSGSVQAGRGATAGTADGGAPLLSVVAARLPRMRAGKL